MKLVEQHLIRRTDPRFAAIDQAAFASKNLYNQANYQIRQCFFQEGKYQSHLTKAKRFTSRQLDRITTKRNRRITAYLHTASRRIINLLVQEEIGTLVIGKNPFWKHEVEMGRKNNQEFVQIPHARFIDLLTYKAKLVDIQVSLQEESYTSKASFLDRDAIPTYDPGRREKTRFSGKRETRGLYRAANGRRMHADVHGSYNILRKAFPKSFGYGIAAPAVVPRRFAV